MVEEASLSVALEVEEASLSVVEEEDCCRSLSGMLILLVQRDEPAGLLGGLAWPA